MKTASVIPILLIALFSNELLAQLSIQADAVSGLPGTQVVVPVRVSDFNNILSIQGTIQFDTSIVSYSAVTQFGLPGLNMSGFGTNIPGKISYLWDDNTLSGVSLPNPSVIFAVRFTVKVSASGSSTVCFVDVPTNREVVDISFNVINASYTCGNVNAQSALCTSTADCDDGNACTTDTCINSSCSNTVIVCNDGDACTTDNCISGVCTFTPVLCNDGNLCTTDACTSGICTYSPLNCDDADACTDDDCVGGVCHNTATNCDDGNACTNDACDPLLGCIYIPINCDDGDPSTFDWCDVISGCVFTSGQLSIQADHVSGLPGTQVIVPVRVFGFNNIVGVQGTIEFDPSVVSYSSVLQLGLVGLGPANFGIASTGKITYLWDDATLSGVSVADSTVIFAIQFTVISSGNSPVCFVDLPTLREVIDNSFNFVNASYTCGNVAGHALPPCDTLICNDANACTSDTCVPPTGCVFTPIPPCDDNDACTTDNCVSATGCVYTPNAPCDDNDVCTNDNCVPATGCVFTPIPPCYDNDDCTTDNCVPATGCVFTAVVCNDGSVCTGDTCINGQCIFTPTSTPEICIVGVDSATGKNIIVWEKPVTTLIDSYIIYRETNQANQYAIIGSQAYGVFSTFIDLQSIPAQNSNKYMLGFADACGQTTIGTIYHKTIHLSINQGVGNAWNLAWNHYEGFPFSTYNVYRGTTPATLSLLNSVASNLDSYSDLNPPSASVIYYQIEVINPNSCSPTAKMGNYSASRSNIANTSVLGMDETESSSLLRMYPNPFNSSITIEMPDLADSPFELNLFDITGKKILTEESISAPTFILNRNTLMQGIFYAELRGVKNIYRGKIIAF